MALARTNHRAQYDPTVLPARRAVAVARCRGLGYSPAHGNSCTGCQMNDFDSTRGFHFLGFDWPAPIFLVGSLIFGLIGFIAYQRATRAGLPRLKWIGIALMLFPYAVHNTALMYVCGVGLSGLAYACRKAPDVGV